MRVGNTWRESTPYLEPARRPPKEAPNVVIVVLDDVGFAQLGCYGSDIDTPHIDALAAGGRRYNNFHTTSMCSPTRASLLTGRNHHAVGMGMIADWCTGFPGYQGQVSRRAATLAEILRPHGYGTFCVGKWHLTRARDMTAAGPFDEWPLGRGFQRYYGFLYSLMDHWYPELIVDNHAIPIPNRPDYHLTTDLVDQAIHMIRDQQAAAPGRPFFTYLALGACHSPHHAPREFIDRYRGRFDDGWDAARERWFARQVDMGIVPRGTRLSPRNPEVREWNSMTADERRLCARHQEVFAGFLTHTDAEIGRFVTYLRNRDLLDNTLFILLSDNGATAEGGDFGDINLRRYIQFLDEGFDEKLAAIDELGGPKHWNNYPRGWGHAGNTPLKWFKTHAHGGGVRDPLIIHWPRRVAERGRISAQFCHCADIAPTVLEAVGIEAPDRVDGVEQLPIDGRSLCDTFDSVEAPSPRRVQYFELMGHRGVFADGWKAVAHHQKGADFDTDCWELYRLQDDFSEVEDLSAVYPDKLAELVALWWQEAERNRVLPLDDRDRERTLHTYWDLPRRRWRFEPGMNRVSGYAAPAIADRSYRIEASVVLGERSRGMLLAVGGCAGGYALLIDDARRLVHVYVAPSRRWVLNSAPLPTGRHRLGFVFHKTDRCAGVGRLYCDETTLAEITMSQMWPLGPTAGGVFCGFHDGLPLCDRYSAPAKFLGELEEVIVEQLDDAVVQDDGLQRAAAIRED